MMINSRYIIFEKHKKWNYIDSSGLFVWENKVGDVIKKEDGVGNLFVKLTLDWTKELGREISNWGIEAQVEIEAMMEKVFEKTYSYEFLEKKFNISLQNKLKIKNLNFDTENNIITAFVKLKKWAS